MLLIAFDFSTDRSPSIACLQAPEVFHSPPEYKYTDVFAFAVIMWELESGQFAFGDCNGMAAQIKISEGERPEIAAVPNEVRRIIEGCWEHS